MERNPLNDKDVDGNTMAWMAEKENEVTKEKYYNQYGLRHKNYKFKDFEDYLMTVFAEGDGATVLDDDFPDAFNDWICDLEPEDFVRFGDIYGKIKYDERN